MLISCSNGECRKDLLKVSNFGRHTSPWPLMPWTLSPLAIPETPLWREAPILRLRSLGKGVQSVHRSSPTSRHTRHPQSDQRPRRRYPHQGEARPAFFPLGFEVCN